jgi:RNA polymerase sigma factor (sigma-70 family)
MKSMTPETRNTLIARLPNTLDGEAWEQFVDIYRPLVFRLARSKGFQDADAHEIAQEVMVAVAGAAERWEPDPQKGRFRDWLFRIAQNLMIKYLTRRKYRSFAAGNSDVNAILSNHPAGEVDPSILALEHRRELFRWAAERVQKQVAERTWQAFWKTSVEGVGSRQVAEELGMTVGAIHIACSRVRKRIRDEIKPFEETYDAD